MNFNKEEKYDILNSFFDSGQNPRITVNNYANFFPYRNVPSISLVGKKL